MPPRGCGVERRGEGRGEAVPGVALVGIQRHAGGAGVTHRQVGADVRIAPDGGDRESRRGERIQPQRPFVGPGIIWQRVDAAIVGDPAAGGVQEPAAASSYRHLAAARSAVLGRPTTFPAELEMRRPDGPPPSDELHHAAHRGGSVGRALRPPRHFHPFHIGQGQTLDVEESAVDIDRHAVPENLGVGLLTSTDADDRGSARPGAFVDEDTGEPAQDAGRVGGRLGRDFLGPRDRRSEPGLVLPDRLDAGGDDHGRQAVGGAGSERVACGLGGVRTRGLLAGENRNGGLPGDERYEHDHGTGAHFHLPRECESRQLQPGQSGE